jgi:hypothetical protein
MAIKPRSRFDVGAIGAALGAQLLNLGLEKTLPIKVGLEQGDLASI